MFLAEAALQNSKIEAMHDDAPFPTKPRKHDTLQKDSPFRFSQNV